MLQTIFTSKTFVGTLYNLKLIRLRARWPIKPVLISGFCSVKQMGVFGIPPPFLDGTLIHCRLASSRHRYSFTYPRRMESWIGLGGKGCTNIQISAEPGLNQGSFGWKAEFLQLHQPCPFHTTYNSLQNRADYLNSILNPALTIIVT